jgi:hypothetical protein
MLDAGARALCELSPYSTVPVDASMNVTEDVPKPLRETDLTRAASPAADGAADSARGVATAWGVTGWSPMSAVGPDTLAEIADVVDDDATGPRSPVARRNGGPPRRMAATATTSATPRTIQRPGCCRTGRRPFDNEPSPTIRLSQRLQA